MRVLGFIVLLTGLVACSGSSPSRTPLAPARPEPPRTLKDSSRVSSFEDSPQSSEDRVTEIEIQVDDGDDDSASRVSSSAATGAACTFSDGPRASCTRLASSRMGACAGSIAERACDTWGPHLDARVEEKWLACLSDTKASGAACTGSETLRCAVAAVSTSCVDGAYRARCQHIADACSDSMPELTRSLCEHAIAAFSPKKRTQIVECLEHGCDTGAFGACIP